MTRPHFTDDFKIDAIKQITERGYSVADVSKRLGVSTHSLYAFNQVVPKKERLDDEFIKSFYDNQKLPPGTKAAGIDPLYGKKKVIFRKVSNNTRVTIFQGGHEIIHNAALNWLAQQRKSKPAEWKITDEQHLKTDDKESESGK